MQQFNFTATLGTSVCGLAVLFSLSLWLICIKNLRNSVHRSYFIFLTLSVLYILFSFIESASVTVRDILFWDNAKTFMMCLIPPAIVSFTVRHTLGRRPNFFILTLICSSAILNIIVVATDGLHHSFRTSIQLIEIANSGYILAPAYGIWYYSFYLFSITAPVFYCIFLYIYAYGVSGFSSRIQYVIQALSVVFLLIAAFMPASGLFNFDIFVVSLLIYTALHYLLIFKYSFLDIVPMAKQFAFDRMGTAVLIFGISGKMIEKNSKASELPSSIPISSMYALNGFFNNVDYLSPVADKPKTRMINTNGEDRYYTAVFHRISDDLNFGKSFIANIYDVTEHHMLAAIEREKERIIMKKNFISDIHDGISGSITVINMIARQDYETAEEMKPALDNIGCVSEDAARDIRLMLGAYDNEETTIGRLSYDMRFLGGTYTGGRGISFSHRELIDGYCDTELDFSVYISLLLFFKECVVNTVKHSMAEKSESTLAVSDNMLTIEYSDNGIGLQGMSEGGYGLKSLYGRIDKIGGKLSIAGDEGLKITAVIPVVRDIAVS